MLMAWSLIGVLPFCELPDVFPGTSGAVVPCPGCKVSRQPKRAAAASRGRLKQPRMVRLEVRVRKDDAALVRGVVRALSDPKRETEARALLERLGGERTQDPKALLAAVPLEGISLEREREFGRDVDL
jgi:hypothetical protein